MEQLNILKEMDCDIAQGFYIGKPKIADEISSHSKTAIIKLEEMKEKYNIQQ